MRLVEIPATNLEPGMFVAEVDRPWLETPFSLQGFVVRDQGDVDYIAQYVERVFVDADYAGRMVFLTLGTEDTARRGDAKLQLKADFQQARVSFETAAETLDRVFDSLRGGHAADVSAVKDAVNPLIEQVFRNQEAVAALLRLKESGDYLYNHGICMALWAVILGRHIGLHRDELEKLAVGCAMCDVGMTGLSTDMLSTREKLTEQQQRIIKSHPHFSAQMVKEFGDVDTEILAIIENHHERKDGSGYPRGIEGSAIPLLARIAGLADTYDAMITPRPYSAPRTSHEAAQELIDCKGILFQDSLVEQFVQAIGLFPTGSLVELNTGEVGIVIRQNSCRRLKPEVVVVLDIDKGRKESLEVLDLSKQVCTSANERWIARELLPGSFGLDSKDYFI